MASSENYGLPVLIKFCATATANIRKLNLVHMVTGSSMLKETNLIIIMWSTMQGFIQAPFGGGEVPPQTSQLPPPRIFGQL